MSQRVVQAETAAEAARDSMSGMQQQLMEARRACVTADAETAFVRKSLVETRALAKETASRATRFDEAYRRLWRATHDPAFLESRSSYDPLYLHQLPVAPSPATPAAPVALDALSSPRSTVAARSTLQAALALQDTLELEAHRSAALHGGIKTRPTAKPPVRSRVWS